MRYSESLKVMQLQVHKKFTRDFHIQFPLSNFAVTECKHPWWSIEEKVTFVASVRVAEAERAADAGNLQDASTKAKFANSPFAWLHKLKGHGYPISFHILGVWAWWVWSNNYAYVPESSLQILYKALILSIRLLFFQYSNMVTSCMITVHCILSKG